MKNDYSVMIISASRKFDNVFYEAVSDVSFGQVEILGSMDEAIRRMAEKKFDILIINAPVSGPSGIKVAQAVCNEGSTGVMFLTDERHYNEVNEAITPYGALVVKKPLSMDLLKHSIMFLCGTCDRIRRMENKARKAEEKVDELKIINRAKWRLIDTRKMTEKEAHRFIEKQAMDRCVTKKIVAEEIMCIR